MRKKLFVAFLCLIMVWSLFSLTVYAQGVPFDPDGKASLTLQYSYEGQPYEGIEIQTYRVADVDARGKFKLSGNFADYQISLLGISSQTEWKEITSTLAAYVVADQIAPELVGVTDEAGRVVFTDIQPGIYLTMGVQVENIRGLTVFESFLTVVPLPDENSDPGEILYLYDVTAYPKCESFIPGPDPIEYKVVKQWKDNGYTEKRPEFVEVDIYKNGELQTTEKLSSENQWSYSWTAPDDGSEWVAVEREIPEGYTVTIVKEGSTIVITNVYEGDVPPPPQTGDTTVLWPYVLVMCIAGGAILMLATWRRGTQYEEE